MDIFFFIIEMFNYSNNATFRRETGNGLSFLDQNFGQKVRVSND